MTRPPRVFLGRSAVRMAWLLHMAGDNGSNAQVSAAAVAFRAAIVELVDACGGAGR